MRWVSHHLRLAAMLAIASVVTQSCTTQTKPGSLSLEEANRSTVRLGARDFTPPPRTIDDVFAEIKSAKPVDPKSVAEKRALVESEPPADADDGYLANFYFGRSEAAQILGLHNQALADGEKAYRYAVAVYGANVRWRSHRNFFGAIIWPAFYLGNLERATEMLELSAKHSSGCSVGVFENANLARIHYWAGDLVTAARYRERFQVAWSLMHCRPIDTYRYIRRNTVDIAEFGAIGAYHKAEPLIRQNIEMLGRVQEIEEQNNEASFSRVGLADVLLQQGRLIEAELAAREALSFVLRSTNRQVSTESSAVFMLAQVMSAQNRDQDAVKLGSHALAVLDASGLPESSDIRRGGHLNMALLHAASKRWRQSRQEFERILANPQPLSRVDHALATSPVLPLVMLKTGGGPGTTADELRTKVAVLNERYGAKHPQTAQMSAVLAMQLAETNPDEALNLFREALPILTSRSRGSDLNAMTERSAEVMFDEILTAYIALLARTAGTQEAAGIEAIGEAFTIADIMRTRSVQDALNASAARAAAGNPELASLARQEQDARQQIKALYGLLSSSTAIASKSVSNDLRRRIDTLRDSRARLIEAIEEKYPDYAALITPKPATIQSVQSVLLPKEAMVAILVADKESYVWTVQASGAPSFAVVPMTESDVELSVKMLRSALAPNVSTLGDIPAFETAISFRLYNAFLAPVENGWKSATTLQLVTHGALTQLPFGVLTTEAVSVDETAEPLFAGYRKVPWLARSYAIANLPSALSLLTLRKLPPSRAGRKPLVAFANPDFTGTATSQPAERASEATQVGTRGMPLRLRAAPDLARKSSAQLSMLPPLPDTAEEVHGIAVALKADPSDIFVGTEASESKVKSINLSNYGVVVFATHGLVPGDLDGLTQPALALTRPSGVGEDGLLTMGEILALRLDADWVVLSACNTAAAEGTGAEAISGLGRAFFYAGTRALLVSNWPVETTSARLLTTGIFTRQANMPMESRAMSLRQAQLALIDGLSYIDQALGKTVFSYSHPIFWAPFSLIGDSRRATK